MSGTSPPKIPNRPTADPTSRALIAETLALKDANSAIAARLDVLSRAAPQGRADDAGDLSSKMDQLIALVAALVGSKSDSNGGDDGATDQATGETAVENAGETNEEEKGHATEQVGGGGATYDNTRARRLASDSARADSAAARRAADAEDDAKVGEAQHRFDEVLGLHGRRCDRPRIGERSGGFRRRILRQMCDLSPRHRGIDPYKIHDDRALDELEPAVLEAVKEEAYNAASVPPDQMREVKERDRTGREITRFVGSFRTAMSPFIAPTYRARINSRPGTIYNT